MPPQIPDSDGWPFKLNALPYRPVDEQDWRKAKLAGLIEANHD